MQSLQKNKIAFVIPWFGENIPGGAETILRDLISKLKNFFEIEVLTTCVKDFHSNWNENFWKEGVYNECNITVRRFEVRKRDTKAFDAINYKLINKLEISDDEMKVYISEMVRSNNLTKFIENNRDEYKWFLFIPYMFGTTYDGIFAAKEKSILIPCFHDEAYAYLDIYKNMVHQVSKVLLNVPAEKRLTEKIFGPNEKYYLTGLGCESNIDFKKGEFKQKYKLNDFILYAGRKDPTKNTPELVDYFDKFQKTTNSDLKLVLIGPGEIPLPDNKNIVDLGFLSKEDKYNAMADALFLCQPSLNESFSIVIMESFICGKPVLVNGKCEVTRDHVLIGNGGLYYEDYYTFVETLQFFLNNKKLADQMATNGKKYFDQNYSWDIVISNYLKALDD